MKRILGSVLALTMAASMIPSMAITASAETTKKTMNMGTDVISADAEKAKERDIIWYGSDGTKDLKWRVLSKNGNATEGNPASFSDGTSEVSADNALFVISENDLGAREFNPKNNYYWQGSNAQGWCNALLSSFTEVEQEKVLKTDVKTDGSLLNKDRIFYISTNEADKFFKDSEDRIFSRNESNVWWWLRDSVHIHTTDLEVSVVWSDGSLSYTLPYLSYTSRPAFNINMSSVLFTSAADFDGTFGSYEGNEWKLTLKDSSRKFAIANVKKIEDTVTVAYTGAETGANEKISYIITDKDQKEIKYYGNQAATSASGSVNIKLPAMAAGDKLFVFNEQTNGDYKTDYASELKEVTIPADSFAVTANVNDDTMGSVTSSKALAKVGEGVTLTATANAGYKFVGFESADVEKLWISGNECMFTMPDKNVTVTAIFEAVSQAEHTVTVVSNYPQMGTASANVTTAKTGDVVTLSNSPASGNSFVEYISGDVNIEGNAFTMLDKDVKVIAMFKANASFENNTSTPIQAKKDASTNTALLRFMWGMNKADGAYVANVGAYILPWDAFNEGSTANPAIVLVPNPNINNGDTFSADYINIPSDYYDKDYCAIPFINGTFFGGAMLYGNVDTYDIDK